MLYISKQIIKPIITKIILITPVAIGLLSSGCAVKLKTVLQKSENERVGIMSNIGNTAVMSYKTRLSLLLGRSGVKAYRQTIPLLNINHQANKILQTQLQHKYPNLIFIPNETQDATAEIAKFNKFKDYASINSDTLKKIVHKYQLDKLIILTPSYPSYGGRVSSDFNQGLGIMCQQAITNKDKWTAVYFATWDAYNIKPKAYFSKSFFKDDMDYISHGQSMSALGANSWGLDPSNENNLCLRLVNKNINEEDINKFKAWAHDFYQKTLLELVSSE